MKKNLKEYGAILVALLLVALIPAFAQSGGPAPVPAGAYKDANGYGKKNNAGWWLPETAGEKEDDDTTAADYAEMSAAGQVYAMEQAHSSGAPVPKGLSRALYSGWNGYFKARMTTNPGPPVKQN